MLDALAHEAPDERRRRVPRAVLVRDVVLDARARVDFELARVDRWTKTRVDMARIATGLVSRIALGIVLYTSWQSLSNSARGEERAGRERERATNDVLGCLIDA